MKFSLTLTILIATALFLSSTRVNADPAETLITQDIQQTSNSQIKSLLRNLELAFTEGNNGVLSVTLENENEISIVLINTGYLLDDDPITNSCYLITVVAKKNNNRKVADALFNNLNRINISLDVGKIIYDNDEQFCYYYSRIWMKNLNEDILAYELACAHLARTKYKKELNNYLNQ